MQRRDASAKKGGRPPCTVAQPPEKGTSAIYCRNSRLATHARRRAVDEPVTARGVTPSVGAGDPASRRTIRRLLRKLKIGCRTARKKKTMGHHPDRNAQFENMARLRREYEAAGDAVISIDTKKKELLGNFHRAGTTCTTETVETFDHDFGSAGQAS